MGALITISSKIAYLLRASEISIDYFGSVNRYYVIIHDPFDDPPVILQFTFTDDGWFLVDITGNRLFGY
jgi:hypothetical protein